MRLWKRLPHRSPTGLHDATALPAPVLVCPRCARLVEGQPVCPTHGVLALAAVDPLVGSTVGSYRFHGLLGAGGMGAVYRGEHRVLGREVAIKVLGQRVAKNNQVVKRFLIEAQACSRIRHRNVVDVTDFGTLPDGTPYLVMELVEGTSLNEALDVAGGGMPLHRVGSILRQVCEALHACHQRDIAHRDLKPDNVALIRKLGADWDPFLTPDPVTRAAAQRDGFWEHVKVLDFGIARVHELSRELDAQAEQARMVLGSPCYLSPEQALGQPGDFRSDLYSLGVLLFEMLTGDVPFGGETARDVMRQHLEAPIPLPRAIPALRALPERIDWIVARAMAKRPEDRYPSMRELHRDLTLCLVEAGLLTEPSQGPSRIRTRQLGSGQHSPFRRDAPERDVVQATPYRAVMSGLA